ncbi:MAG: AMP-binding protein [Alphaproteobacteria bacterium]|nr:AMP-binding protein [Alphaproteobacteria bacterium]
MDLGVQLTPARIAANRHAGLWPDRLLLDYLADALHARPDHLALTEHNSTTGRNTSLSYRQLDRLRRRVAVGLLKHGIAQGDVVSFQLPNWWQFVVTHLACLSIGAISNPVMPIFRERELGFMLGFAESRCFIVPASFRGFDYPAMAAGLRASLPALAQVFVVGGTGADSFEGVLVDRRWEDEADADALLAKRRPGPNDVIEMLYTSGTTGQPKGVMHTSNTLLGTVLPYIERVSLSQRDVVLMGSPMAHQTGFLYGLMMPIMLGTRSVLMDIWNAEAAVRLIHDERVSFSMGATPFLADLAATPSVERYDISCFRTFLSAGAPIPRVLVEQATHRLKATILSGWGMTENGCVTAARPNDLPEKVFGTDGAAVRGFEVRIVDDAGHVLPSGSEGHLQMRGAGTFVGYLKRPQAYDCDGEGWFKTGDVARMDSEGYIRITGRAKDIIIRGGENIPVVEVEEVLYRHPAVQDAAVVGMPDARLGERGCAFVTLKPGQRLNFEEMIQYLQANRMTKNYMPERLEVVDAMPRTPSGKIQKFRLRERFAS